MSNILQLDQALKVLDESGNKRVELAISDRRPPTYLGGEKQGDHVTAYIAYLHMLITAVEGESIQKAVHIIAGAATAILPDKGVEFNTLLANLESIISSTVSKNTRHTIIAALETSGISPEEVAKANEALRRDKRAVFMNATKQICQKFLEEVNLDEEVAFARIGAPLSGAGAKEKQAIHTLKVINELEAIDLDSELNDKADQFDRLYKYCIKTSAPYIMGTNNVLEKQSVATIRKKWTYLKDWEDVHKQKEVCAEKKIRLEKGCLFNELNRCTDKEALPEVKLLLLKELCALYNRAMSIQVGTASSTGSSSSAELQLSQKVLLVSKCFGDLFDFKGEKHKSEVTADPELLYRVTARHIVCMFRAFNKLQLLDHVQGQIIDKFLEDAVLEEQGWKQYKLMINGKHTFLNRDAMEGSLRKYLDFDKIIMTSLSEASPTIRSSSVTSIGF